MFNNLASAVVFMTREEWIEDFMAGQDGPHDADAYSCAGRKFEQAVRTYPEMLSSRRHARFHSEMSMAERAGADHAQAYQKGMEAYVAVMQ